MEKGLREEDDILLIRKHAVKMTSPSYGWEYGHPAKGYEHLKPIVYFFFLLYCFAVVYEDKWTDVIYYVNSKLQKKWMRSTLWHCHFLIFCLLEPFVRVVNDFFFERKWLRTKKYYQRCV